MYKQDTCIQTWKNITTTFENPWSKCSMERISYALLVPVF